MLRTRVKLGIIEANKLSKVFNKLLRTRVKLGIIEATGSWTERKDCFGLVLSLVLSKLWIDI